MKAILEFDLDQKDDRAIHKLSLDALNMRISLSEIQERMRTNQIVLKDFWEILNDNEIYTLD